MHHDRIALGDLLQHVPRAALRVHEVLGDDLEPVDRRAVLEDVGVVDRPQADAEAEMRQSKTRRRHGERSVSLLFRVETDEPQAWTAGDDKDPRFGQATSL